MILKLELFIAFLWIGYAAVAQHASTNIDPEARQQWIKDVSSWLRQDSIIDKGPLLELTKRPYGNQHYHSCKVKEEGGLLEFNNGSWLYMVCHSSHEDDRIGDITLAIDKKGRLYQNLGHICGGIIHFISEPGQPKPSSSKDFIRDFKCDTDGERWSRVRSK